MTSKALFDTKILKVNPLSIIFSPDAHIDGSLPTITDPETEAALVEAARIIRDTDETVAFPTETVYGLGGSALMIIQCLVYTGPKIGLVTIL